jgi:flagellar hook-basal body complex protein FliE
MSAFTPRTQTQPDRLAALAIGLRMRVQQRRLCVQPARSIQMSFMDSIGGQLMDSASQALMDSGSFDLGNVAEFATDAAVQVGVAYATAQFGPVGGALASQAASAITNGGGQQSIGDMKPSEFASFLKDALGQLSNAPAGDEKTVGEMSTSEFKDLVHGVIDQLQNSGEEKVGDMKEKDFFDAMKNLVSQIGRDGQKETKKGGSGGKGEAGASGQAGEAGASEAGGGSGASLRDLAEALGKAVSDRVAAAKDKVSALTADSDQGQILEATSEVGAAGFLATSAGGAMQSAIQGTNELARKG